ncbi:hypothetical protein [Haloglomus halophilum]|uniref:hypothetical protein n=1 Tax=Haloglomus halophilum TaxID=2962672 RepID=UPI0020C978AD|nr:hypothetical protein [Haloglomus halophilum]
MLRRLVPAVVVAVLLVTSPVAAVAAVPPDSGDGAGGTRSDGAGNGSAAGSASGSASGGVESGAGGSGAAGDAGGAANDTRTVPGVGGIIDAAPATDGGRYLVGAIGLRETNSTVTRVAPNGTVRWTRSFGSPNESRRVTAVVSGDSPGAFLLEVSGRPGPASDETPPTLRLRRITADGDLAWQRSLGNATSVVRGPVLVATDDGVALARTVDSEPPAARLTRFAHDGTLLGDRTYRGGVPRALAETDDGGLVVVGQREFRRGWYLRLDGDGDIVRNETFATGDRRIVGATPADDGDLLVAGSAEVRGFSGSDPWVARLDADGTVRWSRTYGTTDREYPRTAVATDRGILLLSTRDTGTGARSTVLTHVTAEGEVATGAVAAERGLTSPVPTGDRSVDLYGFALDRENRTATGIARTVDLPRPAAPDWPVHDTVTSNRTFYRGENLRLPGDANRTYGLYQLPGEYTEFDQPRLVRRVGPTTEGVPAFETATLRSGKYAFRAPGSFWYRIDDGRYELVEDPGAAAFTLAEQDIWRIQPRRSVLETFAGDRLLHARVESDPASMTARVGLARMNGSSVGQATLADALAPGADERVDDDRVFTVGDRAYGTVELRDDRNLTLDAGALPAGLYEVTLTGNRTADATEPATATLVVVTEERNVTLTPVNRTLSVPQNGTATTDLTLAGTDAGLRAIRIDAERRGQPALRLDLELTDALDTGSLRSGAGIGAGRSTADIQTLDVREAPNGSFAVASLAVSQSQFGRDRSDGETPDQQTVTVGLTYAVDAEGIPYSVAQDETITVVLEDEDGN